jgi:hypothetical protein
MINEVAHYGYEFLIAVTVENPNPDIDNDIVGDKVRLAGLPRKLMMGRIPHGVQVLRFF